MGRIQAWTPERIHALSDEQLRVLRENAHQRKGADLVQLCDAELTTRNLSPMPVPRGKSMRSGTTAVANEIAEQMGLYASEMATRLDLTQQTAKRVSAGTKHFVAHGLLDSKGRAKTGGAEVTKTLQFDRILTYRLKDTTVSVTAFLVKDQPIENVRFQISGPPELLPGGIDLRQSDRMGTFKPRSGTEEYRIKEFPTLQDALTGYEVLVRELQQSMGIAPLA